jgi:hypothetical protein
MSVIAGIAVWSAPWSAGCDVPGVIAHGAQESTANPATRPVRTSSSWNGAVTTGDPARAKPGVLVVALLYVSHTPPRRSCLSRSWRWYWATFGTTVGCGEGERRCLGNRAVPAQIQTATMATQTQTPTESAGTVIPWPPRAEGRSDPPQKPAARELEWTAPCLGARPGGRSPGASPTRRSGPRTSTRREPSCPNGASVQSGGITCTSRLSGLTCTNWEGHGFFLRRERVDFFSI